MDCHGKHSIPSPAIGEVWSYMRDNAKGTTPLAQYQLDCLRRDMVPPSKAHIKRLKRCRPLVLRARPPLPAPDPTPIRYHNSAAAMGADCRRLDKLAAYDKPLYGPTRPASAVESKRSFVRATVPPSTTVGTYEDFAAEADRLARIHAAEVARVKGSLNV